MSKYNHFLIMADTANGVRRAQFCDYPDAEVLSVDDFIDALPDLDDGEEVFCLIMPANTDGAFERIDSEYGIH
jgi:hypothetical protein